MTAHLHALLLRLATFVLGGVVALPVTLVGSGVVTNCVQANLEAALSGGGAVTFACSGTITLSNTLTISADTALDAGSNSVTISGGNAVRLLQVNTNVSFLAKGITLSDGYVLGARGADGDPPAPGHDGFGAAILNLSGYVALVECVITNHQALGGTAGQDFINYLRNFGKGGRGFGAAICSFGGTLNLTNCAVTSCSATGGQGSPSTVNSQGDYYVGAAGDSFGGAIYCDGVSLSAQNVVCLGNRATGGTPYLIVSTFGSGSYAPAGVGSGGAGFITNSSVYLTQCKFQNNAASGGIAAGSGGALFLTADSKCLAESSIFSGNTANGGNPGTGGPGFGGAIFNTGDLQLFADTFSSNITSGGTVLLVSNPGQGGAIYSTNSLSINACTFEGNSAIGGNGGAGPIFGTGAPGEGGAICSSGSLAATNSTWTANQAVGGTGVLDLSGQFWNSAGGAGRGGAIYETGGTVVLENVTIAANSATGGLGNTPAVSQGGNIGTTNGTFTLRGSIIANSTNGGDVWGAVTDAGYNICSDGTANFTGIGSLNQVDPMLTALGYNGGPTPTMGLQVGSPARDEIPSDFPPTDQNGLARPQGPAADIGAVEAVYLGSRPNIITQPIGGTVRAGTNVSFTVVASGGDTLFYQWSKNGMTIANATASSLSLTNVQAADAGTYSVIVTNVFGTTPSQAAVLVVDSTPLILSQPLSLVIGPGTTASFSVLVDGPLLAYQWWHNQVPVPGGTSRKLIVGNATAGAQGNYFVVVSNFAGVVTSDTATLSFDASALNVSVPPKDTTVEAGYPATFSVVAAGIAPFAYQWQHNGVPITGATNSVLKLNAVGTNDAGSYSVVVSNGYGTVTSSAAQLTVTPGANPPQLTLGRLGQNLTITFTGQAGRTYRLLSSTNLVAWLAVSTNTTVLAGPVQFVAPIKPTQTAAFYRVVTP